MASAKISERKITQLLTLLDADKRRAYPSGDSIVISPPQIENGEEYAVFDGDADISDDLEQFCVAKIYRVPSGPNFNDF